MTVGLAPAAQTAFLDTCFTLQTAALRGQNPLPAAGDDPPIRPSGPRYNPHFGEDRSRRPHPPARLILRRARHQPVAMSPASPATG